MAATFCTAAGSEVPKSRWNAVGLAASHAQGSANRIKPSERQATTTDPDDVSAPTKCAPSKALQRWCLSREI